MPSNFLYCFYIKYIRLIPLLFFAVIGQSIFGQTTQRVCEESTYFIKNNKYQNLEILIKAWQKKEQATAFSRGRITIPVVVHIVYQTPAENISDEQVHSQIAALNRDFNLENTNLDKVHPAFRDRIAKVGFNFCLANIDPNGLPTNGITRRSTVANFVFARGSKWIYYSQEGGQNAWDSNRYLNIWVTKSTILGYGSKPFENPKEEDGVVVSSDFFGTTGRVMPPFHLGRTTTHEVAHYFNLFHPWNNDCGFDDFVADTPSQSDSYADCPDSEASSCGSRDITANYMNLSDDDCLAMFTIGQAKRMQASLFYARSGLLDTDNDCSDPSNLPLAEKIHIYPNPASYYFCIETKSLDQETLNYRLINSKGEIVQEIMGLPENHKQIIQTQADGIYFLQFFIKEEETIIKKVIVRR